MYPVRVVEAVLARDSVDSDNESDEARVAVSLAGTAEEIEFPSNKIVGLVAVVAKAGTPEANKPPIVKETESANANGLIAKICDFMFTPVEWNYI